MSNPYVGPRTFTAEDSDFFFGRSRELRDLLSLVIAEPLVLFHARSGAGKSSLINTRLRPKLVEKGFHLLPTGRVGGALPVVNAEIEIDNIFTFSLLLSLEGETADPATLASLTLIEYLKHHAPLPEESAGHVLIIDQFEEVMTTHQGHWQEREAFFAQIGEALWEDQLLWVVLASREDYVASYEPYAHYLPSNLRNRFHMERLGIKAAQEAIERPAIEQGRRFERGVALEIIDNLRRIQLFGEQTGLGQHVEPVQLQIVCQQLWEELSNRANRGEKSSITKDDLRFFSSDLNATVDNALARFYRATLESALPKGEVTEYELRNWFEDRLITKAHTRSTLYRGGEQTGGLPNTIVEELERRHLIHAEKRLGSTWYELIHDRFIEPIIADNQRWQMTQSPLLRDAEKWQESGDDRLLYRGERLEKTVNEIVNLEKREPVVQAFLTQAKQAEALRNDALAQQRQEKLERQLLRDEKSATRLRWLSILSVIMLVFALAATGFAVVQGVQASNAQATAQSNERDAVRLGEAAKAESGQALERVDAANVQSTQAVAELEEARIETTRAAETVLNARLESTQAFNAVATAQLESTQAFDAVATAQVQSTIAVAERGASEAKIEVFEQQSDRLLAQSLAFQVLSLDELGNDRELGALLALEAFVINRQLQQANGESGETAEQTDDGLEDTVSEALIQSLNWPYFNVTLRGHVGAVNGIAFSADGNRLYSAGEDGQLLWWDVAANGRQGAVVHGEHGGRPLTALLFAQTSGAGDRLISADSDSKIVVWEPETGRSVAISGFSPSPIVDLAFRSVGQDQFRVMSLHADGAVFLHRSKGGSRWNAPEKIIVKNAAGEEETGRVATAIGFMLGSERRMMIGYQDGRVRNVPIFDQEEGFDMPLRFDRPLTAIEYSDSRAVWVAGYENRLDFRFGTASPRSIPLPHGDVTDLIYTADGRNVYSASADGTLGVWRIDTAEGVPRIEHDSLDGLPDPTALALSPDRRLLASSSRDGAIMLWELGFTLDQIQGGDRVAISPDGTLIATVQNRREWRDEKFFLVSDLYLYRAADLTTPLKRWPAQSDTITHVRFSQDGRWLVVGHDRSESGRFHFVKLSDLGTTGETLPANLPQSQYTNYEIDGLALSSSADFVAYAGDGRGGRGDIELRFLSNPSAPPSFVPTKGEPIDHLVMTGDGQRMISATGIGERGGIWLWERKGEERMYTRGVQLSETGAHGLALSADGRYLAATQDGVRIWDLENLNRPVLLLPRSDSSLVALAFSPVAQDGGDRRRYLIAGGDGLRLWRFDQGGRLPTILSADKVYRSVAFFPDGLAVAAATGSSTEIWPLFDRLPQQACTKVGRPFSEQELKDYLGETSPYRHVCDIIGEVLGGEADE